MRPLRPPGRLDFSNKFPAKLHLKSVAEKVIKDINDKRGVFTDRDIDRYLQKKRLTKDERKTLLTSTRLHLLREQLSEDHSDPRVQTCRLYKAHLS